MNATTETKTPPGASLQPLVGHHVELETNMNLKQEEVEKLMATKSETEWNAMCDEIKRARGGQYPPDWWTRMMMTGLITKIQESWGQVMPNKQITNS